MGRGGPPVLQCGDHDDGLARAARTSWCRSSSAAASRIRTASSLRCARVRGHNMAKAALEMAAWDLCAPAGGRPARPAARRHPRAPSRRACRSASRTSLDELVERVAVERAAGYRASRSRSSPAGTSRPCARLRADLGDLPLMVDANAAYSLADADHLAALDAFDLMMIEQPLDYDDIRRARGAAARVCGRRSASTSRSRRPRARGGASTLGACRIINIKPGRVGGSRRVDAAARPRAPPHGIPVWHGGMLETRHRPRPQHPPLASLPNFSLPGDVAAQPRATSRPISSSRRSRSAPDGTIPVPTGPGHRRDLVDGPRRAGHRSVSLTAATP